MKRLKKVLTIVGLSLTIGTSIVAPLEGFAADQSAIQPKADIIEWRYKTENGKLYRRKFNYSKDRWIGNWEFIGNIS